MPALSLDQTYRTLVFADAPIESWGANEGPDAPTPWDHFARARLALAGHREADAIEAWRRVTTSPGLESRHYLQAWHYLRARNIQPPASAAKTLLGVVVEAGLDEGIDIVAAYADLTARYVNYTGNSVVWEHPNTSLDPLMQDLFSTSSAVVQRIGPIDGARPGLPGRGNFRLSFLTPSGLHYGEGPMPVMQKDGLAGPVIAAAIALMSALIDQSQVARNANG